MRISYLDTMLMLEGKKGVRLHISLEHLHRQHDSILSPRQQSLIDGQFHAMSRLVVVRFAKKHDVGSCQRFIHRLQRDQLTRVAVAHRHRLGQWWCLPERLLLLREDDARIQVPGKRTCHGQEEGSSETHSLLLASTYRSAVVVTFCSERTGSFRQGWLEHTNNLHVIAQPQGSGSRHRSRCCRNSGEYHYGLPLREFWRIPRRPMVIVVHPPRIDNRQATVALRKGGD